MPNKKSKTTKHPFKNIATSYKKWLTNLRKRRPHRSFRRSRRRDYVRQLGLPGYIAFTLEATNFMWRYRKIFIALALALTTTVFIINGLANETGYKKFQEVISSEDNNYPWGVKIGALSLSALGNVVTSVDESQQVFMAFVVLITWLVTVWLLREVLAGNARPRMRDGLYNAGAPLIPTILLVMFLLFQLLPLGITVIIYTSLLGAGLVDSGFGAFLYFGIFALVASLTVYWITSTFMALVIVTLPGMYPMKALRAASDIVFGRRSRLMLRIIWMIILSSLAVVIAIIPIVMIDQLIEPIKWLSWLPLVPLVATIIGIMSTIWTSGYIYLLYRKVVANDAD